jgi:type II secretory pathway predicted ATPase ExeA
MYERFYGLSGTPFAVTPDPAMLFMSTVHREALATILYGVETRKGFIVCTGEVGTGKSTIIRAFFDQVRPDAVKLIYLFTSHVSPLEMAQFVCSELGLPPPASVFAAVGPLQLKLLDEFEHGRTVVLMIDEAQLLPPETLEFLRLLSNFETDTEKLIQIVLVGQPEVDMVLARRDMRQVNQRVALRARLAPFGLDESFSYIDHRLRVSGAIELPQVMTPTAAWLIAEAAAGIPRSINILADNALIAGFGAAQRPLGSQLAGRAVQDFLGKSTASAPAREAPTAPAWRAVRRLRGALARERAEPAEFVPALLPVPMPPSVLRPAAPVTQRRRDRPEEPHRVQMAGACEMPLAKEAPGPPVLADVPEGVLAAAIPPATEVVLTPERKPPLSEVLLTPEPNIPEASPPPAALEVIFVEPLPPAGEPIDVTIDGSGRPSEPAWPVFEDIPIVEPTELPEPEAWGTPIELDDVTLIEPVVWVGDLEVFARTEEPAAQIEVPREPIAVTTIEHPRAIDPSSLAPNPVVPLLARQPVPAAGQRNGRAEWPALARVRSGLAAPERPG